MSAHESLCTPRPSCCMPPPYPSPASGGGDGPSSQRRRASNQRALAPFLIPERVVGLRAQRAEHGLGGERKRGEANAAGVLDGVGDRRRYAERRGLAHAL